MGAKIYSGGSWIDIDDMRVRSGSSWINPSEVSVYSNGWHKIYPKITPYDMSGYLSQTRNGFLNAGVNAHWEPDPGPGWSMDYSYSTRKQKVWDLGVGTVKVFVHYGSVASSTSHWATVLNGIVAAGRVPVVALLGYWEGGAAVPVNTQTRIDTWVSWAAGFTAFFADKPIVWEIWNEPNSANFWGGTPSATEYVNLVAATVSAIRQSNPNACIVAGSVCPIESTFPNIDRQFLYDAINAGLTAQAIDGISLHEYRTDVPENAYEDYNWLRNYSSLPIIVTEQGHTRSQIADWAYAMGTSTYTLQGWLHQRTLLWNWYMDIKTTCLYALQDDYDGDTANYGAMTEYGMLSANGGTYSSYTAVQQLQTIVGSTTIKKNDDGSNYIFWPTGYGYDYWDISLKFNNGKTIYWTMSETPHLSYIMKNDGVTPHEVTYQPYPQQYQY